MPNDEDNAQEGAVAGDAANFPGFAYLQRVTSAMFRAASSQAEEMNEAWSDIRRGRFEFGRALKMWASMAEDSFCVFAEVLRGPAYVPGPAWRVIPYNRKKHPSPFFSFPIEGPSEPDRELEFTSFASFQNEPARNLYEGIPQRVGTRVEFRLNDNEIQDLDVGDYISFIFRKAQGDAPPLAIIVLRVS